MLEESAPAQKTDATYAVVVICAGGGEDLPVSARCQLSGVKEGVDSWAAVVCFELRSDGVKVAVELESDSVTSLQTKRRVKGNQRQESHNRDSSYVNVQKRWRVREARAHLDRVFRGACANEDQGKKDTAEHRVDHISSVGCVCVCVSVCLCVCVSVCPCVCVSVVCVYVCNACVL
jgi:hypothetical protein